MLYLYYIIIFKQPTSVIILLFSANEEEQVIKRNHTFMDHPLSWFSRTVAVGLPQRALAVNHSLTSPHRSLTVHKGEKHSA